MDKHDLDQASAEAWKEVLAHPAADLKNYLAAQGVSFRGAIKPAASACPFCQGKKFGLYQKDGGADWHFKCFSGSCPSGGESGGIEKFIQLDKGVDWKEARKILHQVTGVPDPWALAMAERGKPKGAKTAQAKPPVAPEPEPEPEPEPVEAEDLGFLRVPEIGMNCYEAFWAAMRLLPGHRAELKAKRGMDDNWIRSLGFVSATRENRAPLEALLEKFPEKELLRAGLAVKSRVDQTLRVADVLCGRAYDEEAGEWRDKDFIIIPYIDGSGRIIGLRPHKRGLGNRAFRESEASEFYEKNNNNLRIIYGENFLHDRPKEFEHTCVVCEGEFKAVAARMSGIPAIGFQGIEYLIQNKETKQAVRDTVEFLKRNAIREVIFVFDNEDKRDKPFDKRFRAETLARFSALTLEDHGFKALFGVLPDSWMIDGKADWDGRLAWQVAQAKTHAAGLKAATADFLRFLRDRKGKRPAIRQAPRQLDWDADRKEDIITQDLNKLRHVPKIFTGGRHELDLASEITNWCHPDYVNKLAISKLADALRETYGGYYKPKPPSEALEARALKAIEEIDAVFADPSIILTEDDVRKYRAAKAAAYATLYRYPKSFTDFTAESRYKVLCHEPDGSSRLDRLIVFKDKNGRKSKAIQMAGDKLNSSQELRKFFPKVGGYHWWGNQEECDFWLQELDVQNYQRTITEIDTYGWNREVGIYIMGDCAIGANGQFIFPDKSGIIWYNQLGYKNSDSVEAGTSFCHKPPVLFPDAADARKAYDAIDWGVEQQEVAVIWQTMLKDFVDAFGGTAGYAAIGGMLQYLAHPEILRAIGGKPGLWMQGRKGSGKTKTVEAGMRIFGFPRNYEIVALGSTKVGIERNLSQFSGLPVHIDEWRNNRADDNTVGFITNAFNEIGISKGTSVGTKSTRKSRAATIPIVTGEDGATDPALRSRYLRLIMSQAQRQGTSEQQRQRYFKMLEHADQYHRVGRWIFKHRDEFARRTVARTKEFISDAGTARRISDPRAQEVTGVCLSALMAAHSLIDPEGMEMSNSPEIEEFMLKHGAESCDEITGDVFMVNFFTDAVSMINRGVPHVEKYLRVCRGSIAPGTGKINIIPDISSDEGRVIVLIAHRELYDEYKADKGKLRETASIARGNIQAELKAEDAWIRTTIAPGVHRLRLPGKNGSRDVERKYWALDYERCPPELKEVFRVIYSMELREKDHALDDDEQVVYAPND